MAKRRRLGRGSARVAATALFALAVGAAARGDPTEGTPRPSAEELSARGELAGAIEAWRERAAAAEDGRARTDALLHLAEAQQTLGRHAESLATLSSAAEAAGPSADARQVGAIEAARGNAYLALGPPERALEHLGRALSVARSSGDAALSSAVLIDQGNLHASRDDAEEAARAYSEGAALARQAGSPELEARALANAARISLRRDAPAEEARATLERAAALAAELPASHTTAYLLIHVGRSYARLADRGSAEGAADLRRAHGAFRKADALCEELGDARARSYALGYLGALYEERGRRDEALRLTQRALLLAQQADAPESLYRWQWQAGRILRDQGRPAAAIESYQLAVATLQRIRFEMARGYATGGDSFREAVGPVFFELVDLLLQTAPPASELAAQQARLLEVRETVEQLKAAELRDYFRDECVDALEAKVERIDQVASSAVVIYPVILPDRLELLLTFPSGIRRATVPVDSATLVAEARTLRALLEKRTTNEFRPHAQRLYDWLVRPFEADLAGLPIDTLVFVPDGVLRTIPMAALHDGSRFLIERYALATTPGLSLTDPRTLDRRNLKVFLSGLSEPVQGFPALEHVPRELEQIQALYGGEVLLDRAFQLPRVESELAGQEFSIVHVASHGEFAEDVEKSFLLTWDGRLTLGRMSEEVKRTRLRERPIELLTLSACDTAQGNERAALGLAGVAVQSGARSALGTLWSVNDAASADLMVEFYRQLKDQEVSKAAALQRAQQKLVRDPNLGHPFYWAPYLLISNWL
jgi:CHAT domain-containing protein